MRIGRIGADHIQVVIRPALDEAELLALVDRLEQLVGAGYDTIDVVFEERDASGERAQTMSTANHREPAIERTVA